MPNCCTARSASEGAAVRSPGAGLRHHGRPAHRPALHEVSAVSCLQYQQRRRRQFLPAAWARPLEAGRAVGAIAKPAEGGRVICAWCPNFNPSDPANKAASHGMCQSCEARLNAQIAAAEAAKVKEKK